MIKVIEFIPKMSDGGAETLVKDYCLLLDKNKFDVEILSIYMEKGSANKRIIDKNGVKQYSVFSSHSILERVLQKLFGKFYIPFKLKKYIKETKPDVIHAHLETLTYLNAIRKSLQGIKLLFTCHSVPNKALAGKKHKEGESARSLIKHNGLQLIALHNEMKEQLDLLFDINNTLILHNGIDLSRFLNVSDSKESIREKINIPKDNFVIGHIGRFIPCKNHRFIIEIFNEIVKRREESSLLLIGSGPTKDEIVNLVNDCGLTNKTVFLENRNDVPELLKAMDAFVFPSTYEGFPVTLIEAQSVGLKCVISSVINDEVRLSDNIIKMNLDDNAQAWADAIMFESSERNDNFYNSLASYDMNNIILTLQDIYIS